MSMCRVLSCAVGRGCLLWPVCFLGKTLLVFAASFRIPRPNLPVTPGVSLLPTFAFQSSMIKRTFFFFWCSRRSCRSSQSCSTSASSALLVGALLWLYYCDIEWFALEMNRDHSVIFEIASKYCISDSFVDHDGHSISSEGFLPSQSGPF